MMGTLINDCDQCLFDHIAREVNKLAGTTAIIYQFDEMESSRDPLWDEEIEPVYKKGPTGKIGIECPVWFKGPDRSSATGEEGLRMDRISEVQIARSDLELRGLRRLQPGDIVQVWGDQYYEIPESHVGSGYISDSPEKSMYTFDVVRRTKSPPENAWLRDVDKWTWVE